MSETETEEVTPLVRDALQLQADCKEGAATLIGIADVGDLVNHLRDQVWPMLEALVDQAHANASDNSDLEDTVLELAEGEGEMLMPETAGLFANAFLTAKELADEIESRCGAGDATLKLKIKAFKAVLVKCEEQLGELTVGDVDDEGDE